MNSNQRIAAVLGGLAIALMAVFPPWHRTSEYPPGYHHRVFAGYGPIWSDSPVKRAWNELGQIIDPQIDTTRLLLQAFGAVALTASTVVFLSFQRRHSSSQSGSPQESDVPWWQPNKHQWTVIWIMAAAVLGIWTTWDIRPSLSEIYGGEVTSGDSHQATVRNQTLLAIAVIGSLLTWFLAGKRKRKN